MLRCPSCERTYGGATMEAFGCCPLCLADHQRIERLVYVDERPAPAWSHAADRTGGDATAAGRVSPGA